MRRSRPICARPPTPRRLEPVTRHGAIAADPHHRPFAAFPSALHRAAGNGADDVRGGRPLSARVTLFTPLQQARLGSVARRAGHRLCLSRQRARRAAATAGAVHGRRANYEKMAAAPSFQSGLDQLMLGAEDYRIAVMCSEADPLDCHCCLLVGRALAGAGVEVGHILASGAVMSHSEAEERLLHLADLAEPGLLLSSRAMRLAEAYRCRCSEVAYARPAEPSASRGGTRRRD